MTTNSLCYQLDVLGPSPGARAGHALHKLIIWFLLLEMLRPPLKLLFVNGCFAASLAEGSKKVILGSYIQNFAKVSDAIRSFAYVITCSTQLKMLGLVLGVFAVFAAIVAISLYLFEPRTRQTFVGYLSVFSLISMFASPLFVIITNGLSKLFDAAGLGKFCFPVSRMPKNVGEWPTVADMWWDYTLNQRSQVRALGMEKILLRTPPSEWVLQYAIRISRAPMQIHAPSNTRTFDWLTLGAIKDGPSPGVGHKFTNIQTLGGIKDSGPTPGEGHKFVTGNHQ
ncbi:putative receptor-like protein kinase-like [Capsicum annuum]|nr:putative receptor-like protein kinase-like [Capsicum annuum]